MAPIAYDLHLHTCLSPCGDALMTPPNLVRMAALKELDLIAVTDHNSARNVRAAVRAARDLPLAVVPGMEEIHMVCLFPDCDAAEAAGAQIESLLPPVDNRPDIFGSQLILDEEERLLGEFPRLLINATSLSVDRVPEFAARYGGICFPAHIDRPSNSILAAFGTLPEAPHFPILEVHDPERFFSDPAHEVYRREHRILTNSDAHYLQDIAERERFLALEDFPFFQKFRTK